MAIFDVEIGDKASGPAETISASVTTLANDVGGLSREFDALQKSMSSMGGMSGIMAEQQRNLAHHDKSAYKASSESDVMADIKKQQAAALAGHDQDRDAAAGIARMKEKAIADELAGRSAQQTAGWFRQLQQASKSGDDAVLGFTTQLRSLIPAATAVVAALTIVAGAIGKLGTMAIEATQQKDALREMFGGATLDMLEELSMKLPYTTDALAQFATSLQAAGYSGERLKSAITAVAAAGARKKEWADGADALLKRMMALEEIGGRFKFDTKFEKQLQGAGLNLGDIAKALGVSVAKLKTMQLSAQDAGNAIQKALVSKGQGALIQMGQTGSVIWAKIQEGISDAFEDLGDFVHPFMAEIQSIASEFFKGSVGSKGLAGVVRAVLTPAFQFATQAVHWLHLAFLTLQIYVLRARIALLPVTNVLAKIGVSSGLVSVGMYLLKGAAITLAVVFGLLGVAVLLCALPFIVIGVAIYAIVSAVEYLIDAISGLDFSTLATDAAVAGRDFITGLVNTITGGASWVIQACMDLGASMVGAIKSALQIHSPSRVAVQLGGHFTRGMAMGVRAGTPEVEAAAGGAGAAAVTGSAAGAAAGPASTARGGDLNVTINIEVKGGMDKGALDDLEERLFLLLERVRLQAGLGRGATA